jgi:hypothetical protein
MLLIAKGLLVTLACPAMAQPYDLYVGYKLPQNSNQRAMAAEANCLTDRNIERQVCARSAMRDQCEDSAEIAFRRCILSIPAVHFFLQECPKDKCENVGLLYYPLLSGEVTDPALSPEMHHLPTADRYVRTGISIEIANGTCVFRRSSSGAIVTPPDQSDLCDVARNYFGSSWKGISTWGAWNPITHAWLKHQAELARRLVSRSGETVPKCDYAYDGEGRPFIPQQFGPCVATDGSWK